MSSFSSLHVQAASAIAEKQNGSTAADTKVGTTETERWIFILTLTHWKWDEQRKEERAFCVRERERKWGVGKLWIFGDKFAINQKKEKKKKKKQSKI